MRILNAYDSGFRYGTKTFKDHIYRGYRQGDKFIATITYIYYTVLCVPTSLAGHRQDGDKPKW
jgi:hypothetical protein